MRYEIKLADRTVNPDDVHRFAYVKEDVCCIQVDKRMEDVSILVRAQYAAEIAALNEFFLDHEQTLFIALTSEPDLKRDRPAPFQRIAIDGELGKLEKVLLFLQRHIIERGDGTVLIGRVDFEPYNTLVKHGMGLYHLEILYYFVDEKEPDASLTILLRNFYLDRLIEAL